MKTKPQTLVFGAGEEITAFVLLKWKEASLEAVAGRGYFAAALSGGKTPISLYRSLSEADGDLPWEKTHIFLADERIVPYTHPDSNYGMIASRLLNSSGIPARNRHSIPVEEPVPEISAARYEREIRDFFRLGPAGLPEFDLVILGVGEDGHTASLFPGNPAVREKLRLASAVILDDTRHARITLTLPVINNAKNVIVLLTGKNKAAVARKIIRERDKSLPAALVRPAGGSLFFLLDREAASELS